MCPVLCSPAVSPVPVAGCWLELTSVSWPVMRSLTGGNMTSPALSVNGRGAVVMKAMLTSTTASPPQFWYLTALSAVLPSALPSRNA